MGYEAGKRLDLCNPKNLKSHIVKSLKKIHLLDGQKR